MEVVSETKPKLFVFENPGMLKPVGIAITKLFMKLFKARLRGTAEQFSKVVFDTRITSATSSAKSYHSR